MREPSAAISAEAKRAALEEVLRSRTFDRSEQLRAFLRFICEEEIAGRGDQLNEYQIGVEVLGRAPTYSPGEDAIVRNRAHALRKKLDEYYGDENVGAVIRIEVQRGSYRPSFSITESTTAPPPVQPRRMRGSLLWIAGAFLAGMAVASGVWWATQRKPGLHPVLKEAWGPLVTPGGRTIVHVSAPLHLFVRPRETRIPEVRPEVKPDVLMRWYQHFPSLPPAENLYLRPTPNSLLWGDALGTVIVGRVLSAAGTQWDVLPVRVAGEPVLRGQNVILFGRPEYSRVAERILKATPYTVDYHPGLREYAVFERSSGRWWLPKYVANDEAEVVYGLITVSPSEGAPGGDRWTVLLTGTNSAGIQAAAEFFSSPREMAALRQRFPSGRFPLSYQVVVGASASSTIALDVYYVAHRVMGAQAAGRVP